MKTTFLQTNFLAFVTGCLIVIFSVDANQSLADDWTHFRGTTGSSVGEANLPTKFDEETNLAWKTPMPGKGASGPIVVGDKVIVTCSSGDPEFQDKLYTVCVDAKTGKELWTQKFWATGRCFVHSLSANAAPTPASDGKYVYAFFSSNDMACLDLDGNLVWYRGLAVDNPKAGNDVGMASSPAVKDGIVVAQVEAQGDSFVIGLDTETGKTVWKIDRPTDSVWTSPLIVEANGKNMVVLQSTSGFDLIELKTGNTLFSEKGETSSISSPSMQNGKLFVPINGTTSYAVAADGKLTQEWNSPKLRPSSMSAVVHNDKIFALNRSGVLNVFSANDGTSVADARVIKGSPNWSTPVIANGHMYFFAQNGQTYVVRIGQSPDEKPEVVHKHTFENEVFLGSPAISNDALFVRSDKYLYKIAEQN
jgi:outer membrane protein assembly factor BamB